MRHHAKKPFCQVIGYITVALCLTAFSTTGWAQKAKANEIVVSLGPNTDIQAFCRNYGATVVDRVGNSSKYLLSVPQGIKVTTTLTNMAFDSRVVVAAPNRNIQLAEVLQQSQAFIDQQSQAFIDSNLAVNFYGQPSTTLLNLKAAQLLTRGNGVVVAVIDTGLDLSHKFFSGRIAYPNYDFVSNDSTPKDESGGAGYGHGTFVAGLVGVVAPGAKIMPIRAFGPDGSGSTYDIAKAIHFAADNGADVINMSFGTLEPDLFIENAIAYASSRSFLVASAGNENKNQLHYPCQSSKTLCVAATDLAEKKSNFSNYHRQVGVSAPGVNLYSTYPEGRYATWSGTSFATPLVSGQAALLLQLDLNLDNQSLMSTITLSGVNIDALNPNYANLLGVRISFLNAVNYFFGSR